jgi:DNA helicase MCM9
MIHVISGIVLRRWRNSHVGQRTDVEICILANHVKLHNEQRLGMVLSDEVVLEFQQFWRQHAQHPFHARNEILKSVCPKLNGLYLVKLAVMLVLMGGVPQYDRSGVKIRGDVHLLLVGDPG